jgi:hypothetical protein
MKKDSASRKARPATKPSRPAKRVARRTPSDEILPEYDFRDAVRNPYAARYATMVAEGACIVTLDPDVAAVFPDSSSVNEALRALAGIIQQHRVGSGKRTRG